MEDALRNFNKRQQAVYRKHSRMARGYVTKLDRSGVFLQVPDSKAHGIGLRVMLLAVAAFFASKVLILGWLGADLYLGHVVDLRHGSGLEQVGAWLMQVDPLTGHLAALIAPYLN